MLTFFRNIRPAWSKRVPGWVQTDLAWIAAGCVLTFFLSRKFDLFETFVVFSQQHESWDLDEFALVFVTLSLQALGLAGFRYRQMRREYNKRIRAEKAMADLALTDSLTRLPNRRAFEQKLDSLLTRRDRGCALLMIDLDRFKPVNDLYGHAVGDEVLRQVAERLENVSRGVACVARLGGDEFAVLVSRSDNAEILNSLAARIIKSMDTPVRIGAIVCSVGASVGITVAHSGSGLTESDLLRRGDLALYKAKNSGRSKYCYFQAEMTEQLAARARLEVDFRDALGAGDIRAHYQPLVRLSDGVIEGYEILARWHHPELGVIMPDEFIGIAEDTGLIGDMTMALLRQACVEPFHLAGKHYVAINISPPLLLNRDLKDDVVRELDATGFPAHRLEIEITENALIYDLEMAGLVLWELRHAGVSIALDDFGTGYSSLLHLRKLPIDKLKIDQTFIRSMSRSAKSRTIVEAVIGLAKSMRLLITAEGVESKEMADQLREMGCNTAQGYYFGRAMLPSETDLEIAASRQLSRLKSMLGNAGAGVDPVGEAPETRAVNE